MLEDTTAFVTGASQGIGQRIAITLAEQGANVALAARSDGIYETQEAIDDNDRCLPVETDISDEASVRESVNETVETFGGLDCLVNNAGIAGPTAPVDEVSVEDWRKTLDVNLMGMFLTVKYAVEHLRSSERASIVNVSSISGKRPLPNRTPYVASKMGVIGLTRTWAFELGDDDITVNAICPGATKGPRIEDVIETQAEQSGISYEQAKREMFADDVALGILVDPEDTANMIAFLASEHGRHITAQDINVDGGTAWY